MNKIIQEDLKFIIDSTIIDWNRFANKTILITGANGMLASYMIETLLKLNEEVLKDKPCIVLAMVRNRERAHERFKDYLGDTNLFFNYKDLNESLDFGNTIDFIIHSASIASPKYYNAIPVDVTLPNILGTKNTLDLAVLDTVESYLFFSAGEIYNHMDTLNVRSCYGESKRMGEVLCTSYHHQYNIPTKIARIFHTYGPGMSLEGGRVFEDFVKNVVNNEDIKLNSDGSAVRQFCYIADATIAFFKILLDGENGQAYDVADVFEKFSIKQLAEILVNLFPEKGLKCSFGEPDKNYLKSPTKEYSPDTTELASLGWCAVTSIEEGFRRTVESFKKENNCE